MQISPGYLGPDGWDVKHLLIVTFGDFVIYAMALEETLLVFCAFHFIADS